MKTVNNMAVMLKLGLADAAALLLWRVQSPRRMSMRSCSIKTGRPTCR